MLEQRADHHLRITAEDRFGAVTMMNIKIDDGHTFQSVLGQGMCGGDGDIVEDAETHRQVAFGVMTRRSNSTKGAIDFFEYHHVNGLNAGASSP